MHRSLFLVKERTNKAHRATQILAVICIGNIVSTIRRQNSSPVVPYICRFKKFYNLFIYSKFIIN